MIEDQIFALWRKILTEIIPNERTIAITIAMRIMRAIDDGVLKPADQILVQRHMIKITGFSKKTVAEAMDYLKEKDYIYTDSTRGSYVTKSRLQIYPLNKEHHSRYIQFGQETILENSLTVSPFNHAFNIIKSKFNYYNSYQRKDNILNEPAAYAQFSVNNAVHSIYTFESIYYADHHQQTIDSICRTFLKDDEVFVMTKPAEQKLVNTVNVAAKHVEFVETDDFGILIKPLQILCNQKKVRIVYIRSRFSFKGGNTFSMIRIQELLTLQEKYNFMIIEDDIYAGMHKTVLNPLMEKVIKKGSEIIYLSPLSLINYELNQVVIVAASSKIIHQLKSTMLATGLMLPAVLSMAINIVLKNKKLKKAEVKVHHKMKAVIELAKEVLIDSDLWRAEVLHNKESWFFYLEPKNGVFQDNIYYLLLKEKINVLNPADYIWPDTEYVGITISLAAYLDDDRLEKDLQLLTDVLKKLILP